MNSSFSQHPLPTAFPPVPQTRCRHCHGELIPFLDLGQMPLANGFLSREEFDHEYFYPLICAVCLSCCLVQLVTQPDPARLFHDHYPFRTQSSSHMIHHFQALADSLLPDLLKKTHPFVMEIGSNDGTLLQYFASRGIRHLGIEPAHELAQVSQTRGVKTLKSFFNLNTAKRILSEQGQADVILAANVFCHIPDLHTLFEGLRILLKPGGQILFEDPYFPDVLRSNSYDQIYDEHVFLFTLASVRNIAASHGFLLKDARPLTTHGGSMRYLLVHAGKETTTPGLQTLFNEESRFELQTMVPYRSFANRVIQSRQRLRETIANLRAQRHSICAYGATSKSTTVLNYCQIGPDWIDFICDSTLSKQGKYSPGTHIPIVDISRFHDSEISYALLLAWNHLEEINAKESAFRTRRGQWIVYIPEVRFL